MSTSVIQSSIGVVLLTIAATSALAAGNNSGAAFSNWPGTGLTDCYDATEKMVTCPAPGKPFYGQDAQYEGSPRSYTKLDEQGNALPESAASYAMVQDNVTGLVWEMKNDKDDSPSNLNNPHDADNTYTWCDTNPLTNGGDQGSCGTDNTEAFIQKLNTDKFGGHTDWRLPTMKELLSLVDYKRSGPAIDLVFASTTHTTKLYWTSTTYTAFGEDRAWAWQVSFLNGEGKSGLKSGTNLVRAVRGGQTPAANRFVDNGATVTDTVTCLQWQKATMDTKNGVGPDTYTWQEALAESEKFTLAGHSDWRLPDISELNTLADFSGYDPAIAPVLVPTTESYHYWSSTTSAGNFSNAWIYSYFAGFKINKIKSDVGYVRAVRSGNCSELFPWEIFMPAINNKRAVVK